MANPKYTIKYGETDYVYYPRIDDEQITSFSCNLIVNSSGNLSFSIERSHPLYNKFVEMQVANEIIFLDEDEELFRGRILDTEVDIYGTKTVTCEENKAYLHDAVLRPYESGVNGVPIEADGLFEWYIAQYNKDVDIQKQMRVRRNEGKYIVKGNKLYRYSDQYPTVGQEIKDKILDTAGGYLMIERIKGINYIDWVADFERSNQSIELGENLMDFVITNDSSYVYTACLPTGGTPEGADNPMTISSLPNGNYQDGCYKKGDVVYSGTLVARYGIIEIQRNYSDYETAQSLIDIAIADMLSQVIVSGLQIKSVDLSMIDPTIPKLKLGQYVQVTSKPHDFDMWMAVVQMKPDPLNPENWEYILGRTEETLTNSTVLKVKGLQAEVESIYEKQAGLSVETKKAAEEAQKAGEEASSKNRNFTVQPFTPYSVGDTWTQGNTGDIYVCKVARDKTETFNPNDWFLASKYTDDTVAEAAKQESAKAKAEADAAAASAKEASDKATAAKKAADDATAQVTIVSEQATIAKTTADEAKTAANEAATKAGEVASQVETINSEITQIEADAIQIREDLEDEIEQVTIDMVANYAKKTDLTETETELRSEISTSAAEIQTKVEQDYAKKTDLTTVEGELQTQITQNADNITSMATSVTKAVADSSEAKTTANAATSAANSASTAASAANTAANSAKTAADQAKLDAINAQRLADEAQLAADEALQDAANLSIRADASDTQITKAQQAASTAQQSANTAQQNANAAKTAADTAQSVADTAKASAIAAKASADAAATKAQEANDAVGLLTGNITILESKIEQNSSEIVASFTRAQAEIDSVSQEVSDNWDTLSTYIRFHINGMDLGKINSPFVASLSNTELSFLEAGAKVAWISNQSMHITRAEVEDELAINNWKWKQRSNGNISFKWRNV